MLGVGNRDRGQVMNEVTKKLPSNRLVDYRLKMFDILVKAAEAQAQKGRHNIG